METVAEYGIDSTAVAYINFFAEYTPERKDVLCKIIDDTTSPKYQAKTHLSATQIRQALLFPYSNLRSAISAKAGYLLKTNLVDKQKQECEKALDRLQQSRHNMKALIAKTGNVKGIKEQEAVLAGDEIALKKHIAALDGLKQQLDGWRADLEETMEKHATQWIQLRKQLGEDAIKVVEKLSNTKLSDHEANQLRNMTSLEDVYHRYKELNIEPPIPYKKAVEDPKSLIILMCHLVSREVEYRVNIH